MAPFDQEYVYPEFPPVGVKSIEPFVAPKHVALFVFEVPVKANGSFTVNVVLFEHPF